jgi:hypothetical protein
VPHGAAQGSLARGAAFCTNFFILFTIFSLALKKKQIEHGGVLTFSFKSAFPNRQRVAWRLPGGIQEQGA